MSTRLLTLLVTVFGLAGCDAVGLDAAPSGSSAAPEARATEPDGPALAVVRRATARYHRVDRAVADGWGDPVVSECVAVPGLGGMGHHYVNLGLMDGDLDPAAPEVLLYEPARNGRFRLVGVEYVVPFGVLPESEPAPELFGQVLQPSEAAGGWALHVWVWRNNPAGRFADFNPRVSCDFAS